MGGKTANVTMCLGKGPCISRILIMTNNLPQVEKARADSSEQASTGPVTTDLSLHHLVGIHLPDFVL